MKKSFKFLAILLALITSASGLAPIGAVNPPIEHNPSTESEKKCQNESASSSGESEERENKSTEVPTKREREDESENLETPAQKRHLEGEPQEELDSESSDFSDEESDEESRALRHQLELEEEEREREEIEQRLREREKLEFKRKNAAKKALTEKLTALSESYKKMSGGENKLSLMARCLDPEEQFVVYFKVENLHFTSEEIRAAHGENMAKLFRESFEELNSIIKHIGVDSIAGRTPDQLCALVLYMKSLILQEIDNVKVLDSSKLLYLLSVSEFNGDPDEPELNSVAPPEEFTVDGASVGYINNTVIVSCYRGHEKVYESVLGGQW